MLPFKTVQIKALCVHRRVLKWSGFLRNLCQVTNKVNEQHWQQLGFVCMLLFPHRCPISWEARPAASCWSPSVLWLLSASCHIPSASWPVAPAACGSSPAPAAASSSPPLAACNYEPAPRTRPEEPQRQLPRTHNPFPSPNAVVVVGDDVADARLPYLRPRRRHHLPPQPAGLRPGPLRPPYRSWLRFSPGEPLLLPGSWRSLQRGVRGPETEPDENNNSQHRGANRPNKLTFNFNYWKFESTHKTKLCHVIWGWPDRLKNISHCFSAWATREPKKHHTSVIKGQDRPRDRQQFVVTVWTVMGTGWRGVTEFSDEPLRGFVCERAAVQSAEFVLIRHMVKIAWGRFGVSAEFLKKLMASSINRLHMH